MEYKEIYEELKEALWGEYNGLLYKLHDPFHNYLGDLETTDTLETIEIAKKFAHKLALDINDQYALDTLNLICAFIGETFVQGDPTKVGGTKYDPEYMFDEFKIEDAKQPEKKKNYIVSEIRKYKDANETKETNKEFFFYSDAKKYMDELTNRIREYDKLLFEGKEDTLIAVDEERYFESKDNYIVKILEK